MSKKESNKEQQSSERTYDLSVPADHVAVFRDKLSEEAIKAHIISHTKKILEGAGLDSYHVVILFDEENSISSFHSNRIYQTVKDLDGEKDILMIIQSNGGNIEPAYLISKTCKRLSKSKFNVVVPRKAKSAATLIALGADEVHMGLLSELGPIDPQFGGFPALGLSNAIEKIAAMAEKYPKASSVFAKYLAENINIQHLGLFERINESATQYASRLLANKKFPDEHTPESLADHFTNHYKDHSFVIDADEAASLLGNETIKEGTPEYNLGNDLYEFFSFTAFLFKYVQNKQMRYVGSIDEGLDISEID
ncbi:SDH family Clp fold serine proteinase [Pseudidiomarina atlantica]|uniref:SDH family Clp fold serine proteinase n=1 Tax=Pseudidiomarina atlantica TaxID=1517416 RepID=UPI00069257D3|nr:ATP-dependent Clp protease proteolytic subunit [Pseudidiomarina atlantica]